MIHSRPIGRFPTEARVRKRPEFELIQTRGRRVTTPHFVLILFARDTAIPIPWANRPAALLPEGASAPAVVSCARLGITVSRKVGNAVVRTRTKRLVREAFRSTRELWASDLDLVVIARSTHPNQNLQEVIGEWMNVERLVFRKTLEARRDRDQRKEKPLVGLARKPVKSQTPAR